MTLIVGIFCSDGVVIAADQQLTRGSLGVPTVGQPITKVSVIGSEVLFASSGHAGLGQQLTACIERRKGEFRNKRYDFMIREIQSDFRSVVEPAFKTGQVAAPILGQMAVQSDVVCGSLLAAPFKDRMHLVEISPVGAVESIGNASPFISIGSGKGAADCFLGFLRSVYWASKPPSLIEGALAAFWTVRHVIDMHVMGVGYEADVFALENKASKNAARQLDKSELLEHGSFISAAVEAMRGVRRMTVASGPDAELVPEPPKP